MESQERKDAQAAQGQKLNLVPYIGGYFKPKSNLSLLWRGAYTVS